MFKWKRLLFLGKWTFRRSLGWSGMVQGDSVNSNFFPSADPHVQICPSIPKHKKPYLQWKMTRCRDCKKGLCKSPGDGSGTRQLSRSVHLYILKGALSHNQRGGLSYTWASVYNNLFIVGLVGWKNTEVCHSNGTPRTRAVEASTDRMGSTQGSGVNLTQSLLSYTVCPLAVVYAITQKIK